MGIHPELMILLDIIIICGSRTRPNGHFPRSSIGYVPMLRTCHWAALLAICFWVGYVAAAPLPGVQWSRLSVWEASALADVWARSSEYLDFRSYALCGLSDLGYLDRVCV